MMDALAEREARDIALLQCVSAYPTPLREVNVSILESFRSRYGVPTGLSDHTEDPVIAPTVAAAMDAAIIEKHLTLDKRSEGPDHSFALEPDQLSSLVKAVRDAEAAVGDGCKQVLDIENETYENGRRCLHAARDVAEGERLTEEDIVIIRPGSNPRGIEPYRLDEAIGRRALYDIGKGSPINFDDLD
jgi:N-acetylneuraminate synthase